MPKFFCRRGLQWRRLHLLIFFTEVIKFYWLMLLLYPGELYRLLGASSYFDHCIVCPFYFDHCIVCPFYFDHCIVCPFYFDHCLVCPSITLFSIFKLFLYPHSPKGEGGILFYLCPSFRPSDRPRYFSSHFSQ